MANLLTISRLIFIPVIILLINAEQKIAALIVFIIAGLTDLADGYIARRFDSVSDLGIFLDPLADRLFIVSVLIAVWWYGLAPGWLCALLIVRDILAMLGYQLVKNVAGGVLAVTRLGKYSSAFAMIAIGGLFVLPSNIATFLMLVAIVLAYVSLCDYFLKAYSIIRRQSTVDGR